MTTPGTVIGSARSTAHPSLALIKYWGKSDRIRNLPATPSLAVTLDNLTTETEVILSSAGDSGDNGGTAETADRVFLEGKRQNADRFEPFFTEFRRLVRTERPGLTDFSITVQSTSNFPSAAGLASSASGFAALAAACISAARIGQKDREISALARIGSASAARSVYGGFTRLDEGSESAEPVYDEKWWPDFRIIVLELEKGPKELSSRTAMEQTRLTSPYYQSWLSDSKNIMAQALRALSERDMDSLGPLIRNSYLRMFATMFAADPPIIYWKPVSLEIIRLCETMRRDGISVWETMDAGPQVKLFCLEKDVTEIQKLLSSVTDRDNIRVCRPGGPPQTKYHDQI